MTDETLIHINQKKKLEKIFDSGYMGKLQTILLL